MVSPKTPSADSMQQSQSGSVHQSISMHDNVPVWYDCCSCEAEPYWKDAMEQDESPDDQSSASASETD